MSMTGKVILWVVVAVIVIGGIWWWAASRGSAPTMTTTPTTTTTTAAAASTTPTTTGTTSPSGDSDQSINQDMTNINAQMNGLSSDNASVTQSMNDQPVTQAE